MAPRTVIRNPKIPEIRSYSQFTVFENTVTSINVTISGKGVIFL